ncbi:LPXTG-site transpeptidase (sortase) family protein [Mumia flava]|uniref:LPXTG-site transpeptidase (Sortase) family protein n=1 Tax=Mumia flava TaxID=1348852 RepID=A0A2M9BFW9_9ACTN|nr:class F sortase [Mumia flava]PJJ56832.1 LPXTG-site transpeptidase (sortase) family protein [Mumia flava]
MPTAPDARTRRRRSARALLAAAAALAGAVCLTWSLLSTAAGDSSDPDTAERGTPSAAGGTTTPATDVPVAASPEEAPRGKARPRALRVPSLGVSASVDPMTVHDGVLTPPSDAARLGWWDESARPGSAHGRVVVAGHSVHEGNGAFDVLGAVAPGDQIQVDTQGARMVYEAERVATYDKAEFAARASRIMRRTGAPRLVLITCADWDGTGFASNTVVVARPE